jgi:2-(1,2-epoxy-1,2-dihydrophenyl)acetyl-CoA isomerase
MFNRGMAIEIALSGKTYNSQEALEMGIVHKVCNDEDLLENSLTFAQELAQKGPLAFAVIKHCLNESLNKDIRQILPLDFEAVEKTAESEDIKEGYSSFFEKRKPVYKGR